MWRINIHEPENWLFGFSRGQAIEPDIQKEELEVFSIGFLFFSIEIFWNKTKQEVYEG